MHFPVKQSPHHSRRTIRHASPLYFSHLQVTPDVTFSQHGLNGTKERPVNVNIIKHSSEKMMKRLKVRLGHFCINFTNRNLN